MKTSLGIWALGPMVTRFVPGGYQPQHIGESTAVKVSRAVAGLGDLMDDYEFHYPQELDEENLEEVTGALDGHGIYASRRARISIRCSGRAGCPRRTTRCASRAGRAPSTPPTSRRPRRPDDPLARRRGLQLSVPDAVPVSWARFIDGVGEVARAVPGARDRALPRAQELRARDEDLHAEHRDDAARHPYPARPRHRRTSR